MAKTVVQAEEDYQIIDDSVDLKNLDPKPTDSGWTQFVLDQLDPEEVYNNNPKADGLRRLVEKLRGPIIDHITEVKHCPSFGAGANDQNTSTVVSTITILDMSTGKPLRTSAAADASTLSCPPPYDKYLTSIAETRAEGRVYRKILRLRNVVTSDEIGGSNPIDIDPNLIKPEQIEMINKFCKDLDIDIKKLVIKVTEETKVGLSKYSTEHGTKVMEKLNDVRKHVSSGKKLPQDLIGYDNDWRTYFA